MRSLAKIVKLQTPRAAWVLCALLALGGCTRMQYRRQADRDTYGALAEKTSGTTWQAPASFTIDPDPRSRFYDPSSVVDPELPVPAPQLNAYQLPALPARDPGRFGGGPPHAGNGSESATEDLQLAPIPPNIWDSLPAGCRRRMFEFASIREEYQRTFGRELEAAQRDPSPRLALEDVVDLAAINSREYQTEKEKLYRTALALTLARFDYDLKFAAAGNRNTVDYTHNRDAGVTVNHLQVPTTITGDKVLATAGDLLARFANDVVLTFNGPDGFAADIGSELLFEVSQSVFQRDMVFENLTQAERDVVYAARDFSRYRKTLFTTLASDYYNLLISYRLIEIRCRDYFSQLRGFYRARDEAKYRPQTAGRRLPQFQVDQFEQSALGSRSALIAEANSLERSLDRLKLRLGLPTELAVQLDLTELEQITLRDETTAAAERVRRAQRSLRANRDQTPPDRTDLLNGGLGLADRMLRLMELRERLEQTPPRQSLVRRLLIELAIEQARLTVREDRAELQQKQQAEPPSPPELVFGRTMDVIDGVLALAELYLALAAEDEALAPQVAGLRQRKQALRDRADAVSAALYRIPVIQHLEQVPQFVAQLTAAMTDAERFTAELEALLQLPPRTADEEQQQTLRQIDRLLAESDALLATDTGALTPVVIDVDEALLTALTGRLDLMNQRGAVADAWRQIKLAGDDLKSILNLHASQVIRTPSEHNRPFAFTFDESQTRLRMTIDAPFNRLAQRNRFRQSLINYHVALRSLMAAEDDIKYSVRDDLRQLAINLEQYRIYVASAALAKERVDSTRALLIEGAQGVTARDVLEAISAYTLSLNNMARTHITYLLQRIEFFLALELLQVDDQGFWPYVYDERHQPRPNLQWPPGGLPPYGELPHGVWYSPKIKRMLHVPVGQTAVLGVADSADATGAATAAPLPPPADQE